MNQLNWIIAHYHNVTWEDHPATRPMGGSISPEVFEGHIKWFLERGDIVDVQDAVGLLQQNNGPKQNLISFWFDDAFRGVREHALPILKHYRATAAVSACSRFALGDDLFWRMKLGYLASVDGIRILRSRLRPAGYKQGMSVKGFVLDHFSEEVVETIHTLYEELTDGHQRREMLSLFDDTTGLKKLSSQGWLICNHTARHYPVGEAQANHLLEEEFKECQNELKGTLTEGPSYYVLPFDRPGVTTETFDSKVSGLSDDYYCVYVRDRPTQARDITKREIFRYSIPPVSTSELSEIVAL